MENNEKNIELDNTFILDDDFAPDLGVDISLGDKTKNMEFIILQVPTDIPGELNVTILQKTKENLDTVNNLLKQDQGFNVLGFGTALNTNMAELMYGLNFATRNLFRASIGNMAKSFTDSDRELRMLIRQEEEQSEV